MFRSVLIIVTLTILIATNVISNNNLQFNRKNFSNISLVSKQPIVSPTIIAYIIITETPIPTATPEPTLTPAPTSTLTITPIMLEPSVLGNLFNKYAQEDGIDVNLLKKIAICESYLNPAAKYEDYGGLYQFSSASWITTRQEMNLNSNTDLRFNSEEAIKTAAYKIKMGGVSSWPNCGR